MAVVTFHKGILVQPCKDYFAVLDPSLPLRISARGSNTAITPQVTDLL